MTNEAKIEAMALEPCPICGNQPRWRGSKTDYRVGIFRLQCMGETHLFQAYGATEKICVAAWNTRAPIATAGMVPRAVPDDVAGLVFGEIKHGDEDHQTWLREALRGCPALTSLASTVADLERQLAEAREDKARLDFLDEGNRRLNARFGTDYGWELIMNHNVNRLMLGDLEIDLYDSCGGNHKLPSCRSAIDKIRAQLAQKSGG